jgi:predicted dienelactone hydrolase
MALSLIVARTSRALPNPVTALRTRMAETVSPLGRHAERVAAVISTSVVLTWLGVRVAASFGAPVGDTGELDTAAIVVLGYVLGGITGLPGQKPRA